MELRKVGDSGLAVSRMGLGTMGFGSAIDVYGAIDQLTLFADVGGTLIDTAPIYGHGHAEEVLGQAMRKVGDRDRWVLAGKAGMRRYGDRVKTDASRKSLLGQLDSSLKQLGVDYLDVWQIQRWDPTVPIAEVMATVNDAIVTGKVLHGGICDFTGWQTALAATAFAALRPGNQLASEQVEYSLLRRDVEDEVLPAAEHVGLGVFARCGLGRGVLTGKYRAGIPADSRAADPQMEQFVAPFLQPEHSGVCDAVAAAAQGLGVPMSHVALAWTRDRAGVASVIFGARTIDQLRENLAADHIVLPQEIIAALDDVSAIW